MVITVSKNKKCNISDYKKMMGFLVSEENISNVQKEFFNYISANCNMLKYNSTLESVLKKGAVIPEYKGASVLDIKFRYNMILNQLALVDISFKNSKFKKPQSKSMYDVDINLKLDPKELSDIFRGENVSKILSNSISDNILDTDKKIPFPLNDSEDEVEDFIESLYDLEAHIRQSVLQEVKKNTQGWNIFRKVSQKLDL